MATLAELDPHLSLDQLEKGLRDAEMQLEGDDGRTSPAEVISFTQGTVEGRETNVATFLSRKNPPTPLVLLSGIPEDPFEKEAFFQSLGRHGYGTICYSDVLVDGKTIEVATCRQPWPEVGSLRSTTALISQAAFDLMVEFEGLDQPGIWPGAFSGISLGFGYDLGQVTEQEFENDWQSHLASNQIKRLDTAIGKKGAAARTMAPGFSDIKVSRCAAMEVFTKCTLPRCVALTAAAFPGVERLPANAQGALISLVYNRGTDMKGARRREMAEIRRIITTADLPGKLNAVLGQIAAQIESMKRLWDINTLRGLHRRRDAEAQLVLSAASQGGGAIIATAPPAHVPSPAPPVVLPEAQATGEMLVQLAAKHINIGEKYRLGAMVPKNSANYQGPWDCAEFVSWCIFQVAGILYGCENNQDDPARADAYTGYWERDALKLGRMISVEEAATLPGAAVLRYPPSTGTGHIVFSDGKGGTLEAKGTAFGVVSDRLNGRRWDTGILINGIRYQRSDANIQLGQPPKVYFVGAPAMDRNVTATIQQKLHDAGFDPGPIDGDFSDETAAAVLAFQLQNGLVADAEVGPETAHTLGVML